MLNIKKINEIKERLSEIKYLSWKSYIEGRDHQAGDSFIMVKNKNGEEKDIYLNGATDDEQDFIANAPGYITFLIEEIERLNSKI